MQVVPDTRCVTCRMKQCNTMCAVQCHMCSAMHDHMCSAMHDHMCSAMHAVSNLHAAQQHARGPHEYLPPIHKVVELHRHALSTTTGPVQHHQRCQQCHGRSAVIKQARHFWPTLRDRSYLSCILLLSCHMMPRLCIHSATHIEFAGCDKSSTVASLGMFITSTVSSLLLYQNPNSVCMTPNRAVGPCWTWASIP